MIVVKACTQCGRCCTQDGFRNSLSATAEDIRRWEDEFRFDILEYIGEMPDGTADLWIHPETGEEIDGRCPFVRKVRGQDKYFCRIYETRPKVCRDYPMRVDHMKVVNCDMLEAGDTDVAVAAFIHA